MARRRTSIFNLSFLDLLTSALGAIIFLFVITPKGGEPAASVEQAFVYFDTTAMKIHGSLDDSLANKDIGDTLFVVMVDYKDYPKGEAPKKPRFVYNEPRPKSAPKPAPQQPEKPPKPTESKPPKPEENSKPVEKPPVAAVPSYKGDAPSVPANVSFEINWGSKDDNVDLRVCKGSSCVYGGRKKDRSIGNWDSGKSRNRLFGNDLRTTQEAVRQFDGIIPGEYRIMAHFKDSKADNEKVRINGLVYTKNDNNQEQGESFTRVLSRGDEPVLIGTVTLFEDGSYQFKNP